MLSDDEVTRWAKSIGMALQSITHHERERVPYRRADASLRRPDPALVTPGINRRRSTLEGIMTVAGHMVWFIGMAIAVTAILTIGTLSAADIIRLPHPRRSRHQRPPESHPALLGLSTTPEELQEPGARARSAPPVDDRHGKDAAAEDVDSVPGR
jgi:hypothetical protein